MSEQQAPDRTIRGFGAARNGGGVHPDASRLLARNRVTPPNRAATPSPGAPAADAARVEAVRVYATSDAVPAVTPPSTKGESSGAVKTQINVTVSTDLRTRVRSAYRATSAAEKHRTFSDFAASLLEAEASRLEAQYNDGQRFGGGQEPLTPGRPLDQ